jgi:SAM-dependent methyltransferase
MDAQQWDNRYKEADLVWSAGPNMWIEQVAVKLAPGRALDLAAGEGRNALWLVERGWRATAVDFSQVALDRAARIAVERLGARADCLETVCADLLSYRPEPQAYDLVLLVYLQLVAAERAAVIATAAGAVAPTGRLVVVAHDTDNLRCGYGGPPDPAVLYDAEQVATDLSGSNLTIERADQVVRVVDTPDGPRNALDVLVVASR